MTIHGKTIAGWHYKLEGIANDIMLFLLEQHITFLYLLKKCNLFQYISNLKINFCKFYAFHITLQASQVHFLFTWQSEGICYLGIQLLACL